MTKKMMQKTVSLLVAIAFIISMLPVASLALPGAGVPLDFPWNFEDGDLHGIIVNDRGGTANVALATNVSHGGGTNSILVSARTTIAAGPLIDLTKYITAGSLYRASVWVYNPAASGSVNYSIRVQTGVYDARVPGVRAEKYVTIVSRSISGGQWGELAFDLRFDDADYQGFYVETTATGALANFNIDDVSLSKINDSTYMFDPSLAPLKDAYKDYFYLGTIMTPSEVRGVRNEAVRRHFDIVSCENLMKPVYMSTAPGVYTPEKGDIMLLAAQDGGMLMHGHTLVWHSQSAPWLNPSGTTRAQALANLEDFIKNVAGHYSGKIYSWDVVNEIMGTGAPNGNWKNSVTTTPSRTAFANGAAASKGEDGTAFIYYAFVFARKYDPYSILYYNDFSMNNANKVDAVCLMVNALNARYAAEHPEDSRLLIEGVGMQDHDSVTTSIASHESAIQKLIATGVRISVTELDITISGTNPTPAALATQANVYAQYFALFKKYAAYIDRVTLWGLDDVNNWKPTGYVQLFNEDLSAKPAYYAVLNPEAYLGIEPILPPAADVKLTTAAHLVKAGDYFTLNTAFTKKQNSNAAILDYAFDGSKFEYAGFTPAAGVQVLNTDHGDGYAKLTVVSMDYDLENFGDIMLRAKVDATLANEFKTVSVAVDYVQKLADGTKKIRVASATASFTTLGGSGGGPAVPGDTNGDGIVDLIDLSNMIDWFGYTTSIPGWLTQYVFFDFNNNGEIDISDLAYVAVLIS